MTTVHDLAFVRSGDKGDVSNVVILARDGDCYAALNHGLRPERVAEFLAGQVTEQCVLYSALDAYVRHFKIKVVRDAVAHIHPDLGYAALRMMDLNMRAEIVTAAKCL